MNEVSVLAIQWLTLTVQTGQGIPLGDISVAANASSTLPTFDVYIRVDDKSFSTPSKEFAGDLKRPVGKPIEHKLSGTAIVNDYSFLQFRHLATGMGVNNNAIGFTQMLLRDIENSSIK